MNDPLDPGVRREHLTKLVLISLFGLMFVAFTAWAWNQGLKDWRPAPFDLLLLAFAVYRLGRLVAFERVADPLRRPFTVTVPDHTGAGESVEPRGTGVLQAFGQLISCPICAGTWIAAFLTYALFAFPGPARLFLMMTAAIGAAELLHNLTEALCWTGQLRRTQTGELERQHKRSVEVYTAAERCEEEPAVKAVPASPLALPAAKRRKP